MIGVCGVDGKTGVDGDVPGFRMIFQNVGCDEHERKVWMKIKNQNML